MIKRRSALVLSAAIVALTPSALADWPMSRHDAQRTGAATGTSNLTSPAAYWKYFLGGRADDLLLYDVDNDGSPDALIASGGRLTAKRTNDTTLWQTKPLRISAISAVTDIDGDGQLDVVAASDHQVVVLKLATGDVEWTEPDGEVGVIGVVRVTDLNHDGRDDIYVQECACCAGSHGTGAAYSFGAGFASTLMWNPPPPQCAGGGRSTVVIDVDGDGKNELSFGDFADLRVLDGPSGATLATSPNLGDWIARSFCVGANVDGVSGDELVCAFSSQEAPTGTGHRVLVLKYNAAAASLDVLWQKDVGSVDQGLAIGPEFVTDLDGDGAFEIAVSGQATAGTWTTLILDAATGAVLGTTDGERLVGAITLGGSGKVLLTSIETAGSPPTLAGSSFSRAGTPPVVRSWSLPSTAAVLFTDHALSEKTSVSSSFVAADLNGDSVPDLLTQDSSTGVTILTAYDMAASPPTRLGAFKMPDLLVDAALSPRTTKTPPSVVTVGGDGFLNIYDNKLTPLTSPGASVGGYYAKVDYGALANVPVVAKLDGAAESIVASTSSGQLVRLEATGATMLHPPTQTWRIVNATAPIIVPALDSGKPGVACKRAQEPETTPPTNIVAAMSAGGVVLWSQPIDGTVFTDLVAAKVDADSTPDILVEWGRPSDVGLGVRALSGASGSQLWSFGPLTPGVNRNPGGIAVADWNGDGSADALYQHYATRIVSGATGSELASGGTTESVGMPIVYDVDGDGSPEVVLQANATSVALLNHDLSTAWVGADADLPFVYHAIAACGSGPRLVGGSLNHPARLKMTNLLGGGGTFATMVLAGGKAYPDETTAAAAGEKLGQLSAVAVHSNLTGKGRPSAVVGSEDGWLYAVDPCAGALDFSLNFGAPVGAAVFGDTDGDGKDEVLVSVADGFLYDVKQGPLPAPTGVIDTDPPHGITDKDIDDITTLDTLYAAWKPVSGASSYQVSIAAGDGSTVTSPEWIDVGAVTVASVPKLTLRDAQRYFFAVRAVGAGGVSPDSISNGVVVHLTIGDAGADAATDSGRDATPPDDASFDSTVGEDSADSGTASGGDSSGGCGCRTTQSATRNGELITLVAATFTIFDRRRRRRSTSRQAS